MKKNDIDSYPIVLTAVDISEILQISKPSAYELMKRTDFPLIKIGRCKRVLRDQFYLWLSNHK
ncbi:helix-turn-helix domain-containing protein [Sporosarcina sp. NPDC096371]|uniref:helix-turn-helix domain-containing protein n=1 Tax=Sporosarcina sp. NPDC096371 TaxID=3364530 RepID=UPI0038245255